MGRERLELSFPKTCRAAIRPLECDLPAKPFRVTVKARETVKLGNVIVDAQACGRDRF